MPDGHPPPRCGNVFVAVHQKTAESDMQNALNEFYDWSLTLTMRVMGYALDRIGDQLLASQVAEEIGFNRRANKLISFFHMDWVMMAEANQNLLSMMPEVSVVYGFSEPARFGTMETPVFVGAEWFNAEPEDDLQLGLKSEIQFVNCRRGPQAIAYYS